MGKSFEFIGDSDLDVRFIIGSWTYLLLLHISSIVCLFSHYNLIFMHFISSSLCRMMYDCQRCLLIYIERRCMHSEFISFRFLFEVVCVLNFFTLFLFARFQTIFSAHYIIFHSGLKKEILVYLLLSFILFICFFFLFSSSYTSVLVYRHFFFLLLRFRNLCLS